MRRALVAASLHLAAAAWLACGSFGGADVADAGAGDAGGPDALGPDALGSDAETADGPKDAGSFCKGKTELLCDDFERDGAVNDGWSGASTPVAAELLLSALHPRSGERSLELRLLPSGEEPRRATLRRDLPPGVTTASVDFWIHYETAPSSDTAIAVITLTGSTNVYVMILPGGGVRFAEQRRNDAGTFENAWTEDVGVASSAYRHVRLEVSPGVANAATARLDVDKEGRTHSLEASTATPEVVQIGATYSAPSVVEDILFYDDVLIEASPR